MKIQHVRDPESGHPVLPVGTLLPNSWRIDKLLGAGGFGSVYAASNHGRVAALKEFRPHPNLPNDALLERVEMEASIVKAFNGHPCLPGYIDRFDIGPLHFLAEEMIPGQPLSKVLARGPGVFTVAEALAWLVIITRTLDHLHRRLLLYQDLKPANILIRPNHIPALIDFGAARHYAGVKANPRMLFGSLGYIAPEILQDPSRQRDYRSDVYSLGCLAYTLLTGRILARDQITGQRGITNPAKAMLQFHREAIELPENWGEALNSLLLHALEPDPRKREGDLDWFQKHLQGLILRAGNRERIDAILRLVQNGMNEQDRATNIEDEHDPETNPDEIVCEPQLVVFAPLNLSEPHVVKSLAVWSRSGQPVHAVLDIKGPGLEVVEKSVRSKTGRIRVKVTARRVGNLDNWSQGQLIMRLAGGRQKRVAIRMFVCKPESAYLNKANQLPPFLLPEMG